jgi:hypothetical protein
VLHKNDAETEKLERRCDVVENGREWWQCGGVAMVERAGIHNASESMRSLMMRAIGKVYNLGRKE